MVDTLHNRFIIHVRTERDGWGRLVAKELPLDLIDTDGIKINLPLTNVVVELARDKLTGFQNHNLLVICTKIHQIPGFTTPMLWASIGGEKLDTIVHELNLRFKLRVQLLQSLIQEQDDNVT